MDVVRGFLLVGPRCEPNLLRLQERFPQHARNEKNHQEDYSASRADVAQVDTCVDSSRCTLFVVRRFPQLTVQLMFPFKFTVLFSFFSLFFAGPSTPGTSAIIVAPTARD